MKRGNYLTLACSNPACGATIYRQTYELAKAKAPVCSKACQGALQAGRTLVDCTCSGCGVVFRRPAAAARRAVRHYCTMECMCTNADFAAQASEGWAKTPVRRPVAPLARFLRSQKAGFARARSLSPQRLREIALLGVAARLAKKGGPPNRLGRRTVRRGVLMEEETTKASRSAKRARALSWVTPLVL